MEGAAAPLTEETIDELTDLFQAFKWLQKLQINSQGIKDLEDAKCRLLQYLQDNYGLGQPQHTSVSLVVIAANFPYYSAITNMCCSY